MQNKPNVKNAKMNINPFMTIKYEKMDIWWIGKTNPIQTQFKPNSLRARMIVSFYYLKYRAKSSWFLDDVSVKYRWKQSF